MKTESGVIHPFIRVAALCLGIVLPSVLQAQEMAAVVANNCVTPPSGLVSWWRAEGNGQDSTGTNSATLQGGVSFTAGEVGQCFAFNSTNLGVRIPASPSLNVGAGAGLTVECWVNPADLSPYQPLVEWNDGTNWGVQLWGYSFAAGGAAAPGTLYGFITDTSGVWHQIYSAGGTIASNVFQHVALTYDKASGVARLYCNGAIVAQQTFPSLSPLTTYDVYLGRRPIASGNYSFNGLLDEVSIYNRALSQAELQAIYAAGSAGKCVPASSATCTPPPAGLVGWWRAEGNGDDAIFGNNGTLFSGTTFVSGEVGQAFNFDGVNSAVTVPASSNLAAQSFTIEGWICPSDLSTSRPIVEYGAAGQISPVHLWHSVNGFSTIPGNLYANIRGPSGDLVVATAGGMLTTNQWSHVAFTYDNTTHLAILYCNGVVVGTNTSVSAQNPQTFVPLNIGYRRADSADAYAGRRFAGRLDEISIYNRALGATEIQAIYAAGSAGKCVPPPGIPAIAAFSPIKGAAGAPVTITGTNFSSTASNNIVYFGAVRATVLAASRTSMLVSVPSGATYAPITVTVNGFVAYAGTSFLPSYTGNGSGVSSSSLAPQVKLPSCLHPYITVIGDLDGDGKPDLAVIGGPPSAVWIYRNISTNGTLAAASFASPVVLLVNNSGDDIMGLALADLIGDGRLDVLVANRTQSRIAVFQNQCTPGSITTNSFGSEVDFAVGAGPFKVVVSDLDGDGHPDIIAASYDLGAVSVLHNLGASGNITTNSFAPSIQWATGPYTEGVAVGDLDGDGKPEIVAVNGDNTTSVFQNQCEPGIITSNSFGPKLSLAGGGSGVAIVDLDGDGWQDIATVSWGDQRLAVYRNLGISGGISSNSFAPRVDFATASNPHHLAVGDLDGDGKPDLAIATEMPSYLSVFRNVSTPGSFSASSLAARLDFASGTDGCGVSIGDLDGDGRPDLAMGNNSDANMSIYQNVMAFGGPPAITSQPAGQTVYVGGTATFTVSASGTLPLSYQWRYAGGDMPGATNATLTFTNVQSAQAGNYSVFVSNSVNSILSSNALLTVLPPPACDAPPAGLISWWRAEGNSADAANVNPGALVNGATFAQGEVGNAFSLNGVNQYISAPDSPSLRPTNVTVECWVNFTATDGTRALIGKPYGSGPLDSYALYYQGGALKALISTTAGFGPTLSYTWAVPLGTWHHVAFTFDSGSHTQVLYLDGVAVASGTVSGTIAYDTHPFLIGADIENGSYSFFHGGMIDEPSIYSRALTAAEIAGIYNAAVSGKCKTIPPSILAQPAGGTVYVGQAFTFSVSAGGETPLAYQWQWNNSPMVGQTNSSLVLLNVQTANAGTYSVVVSNLFGSVTSSNVALAVLPPPDCATPPAGLISWWRGESDATDALGNNPGTLVNGATLAPGEVGNAFSLNGVNQYISAPDSPSLRPTNVTVECWVNFTATDGTRALIGKPYGSGPLDSYALYYQGGALKALISTTAGFGPTLSYTWAVPLGTWHHVAYTFDSGSHTQVLYLDGVAVASGTVSGTIAYDTHPFLIGADIENGSYSFFHGGMIDEPAIYSRALTASEIAGIYNAAITGKCRVPAFIITPPVSQRVTETSNVTFSVAAGGNPNLRYQWLWNGASIPGATASSLTLSNISTASAGLYSVQVTNAFGSVISSNALLTVNRIPVALATNVIVAAGPNCLASASVDNGSFDPDGDPIVLTQTPPGPYPLGTNAVALTVTDDLGAFSSASALVIVQDQTPPTVVCPSNIVQGNDLNQAGTIVTFPLPVATDNCSAVTKVTCTPPSGSFFPVGVTIVQSTATDAAGNVGTCSFTVSVLGARGAISNALAELQGLQVQAMKHGDGHKLDKAIPDLMAALGIEPPNPALWLDEMRLDRQYGKRVFENVQDAVKELHGLLKSKGNDLPDATLQNLIGRLVQAARLVAVVSIQDGANAGVIAARLTQARQQVAAGDQEAAAGKPDQAVQRYENAWRRVSQAKVQIASGPSGASLRLEFAGVAGQTYQIQASTNLLDWVTVGVATADPDGHIGFADPDVTKHPARFYRVLEQ